MKIFSSLIAILLLFTVAGCSDDTEPQADTGIKADAAGDLAVTDAKVATDAEAGVVTPDKAVVTTDLPLVTPDKAVVADMAATE